MEEYKVLGPNQGYEPGTGLQQILNREVRDGWLLHSVIPQDKPYLWTIILKRPL